MLLLAIFKFGIGLNIFSKMLNISFFWLQMVFFGSEELNRTKNKLSNLKDENFKNEPIKQRRQLLLEIFLPYYGLGISLMEFFCYMNQESINWANKYKSAMYGGDKLRLYKRYEEF